MIIKPENTAIVNGVSKSTVMMEQYINRDSLLLDYGAGKLRNARYLKNKGYQIHILDTKAQLSRISLVILNEYPRVYNSEEPIIAIYDAVLLSFVLNVIPYKDDRDGVLNRIESVLKPGGLAFIEVRRYNDISSSKNIEEYKDGYLMGTGNVKTFQKPYEKEELSEYLLSLNLNIKSIIKHNSSIIAVIEKEL